jgi:hypothetical protein
MKTMNFHQRFGLAVISGAKRTSVRAGAYVAGQPIGLAVDGAQVDTATVSMVQEIHVDYARYFPKIKVDGVTLSDKSMERLAREDGFDDVDGFIDFVSQTYGLPFKGSLVTWVPAHMQEVAL